MLSPTLDTLRLFLHVLSAAVWVGGQIVIASIVPSMRRRQPDALKVVAQGFARAAWPAFAIVTITGMWSLMEVDLTSTSDAYQVTVLLKVAVAIAAGIAAAVHTAGSSRLAIALGGALGAVFSVFAMYLGILLGTA